MRIFLLTTILLALACSQPGLTDISADDLLSGKAANALILDVRTAEEFASGHVPGAINIPHTELGSRLDEVGAKDPQAVVVYCERGGRAGIAADVLLQGGYTRVLHLDGDMSRWRDEGRPTERP